MKNTKEDFLKQIKESQIKQQKVKKLINQFIYVSKPKNTKGNLKAKERTH